MDKIVFEEHEIFERIDQVKARIREKEVKEEVDINRLHYFQSSISYVEEKLRVVIPVLVQDAELQNIVKEIDAGLVQVNTFIGNKNDGHLTNAENNFKNAVNRTRNLISPANSSTFEFAKSISNFEKTVLEAYEHLKKKNTELTKELEAVRAELLENKNILEEQNNDIAAKEVEIATLTSSFETQLEAIKETAESNFELSQDTFRSEFDSTKKEFSEEFNLMKENIDADTSDLVEKLGKKLEEGKRIVNVIGNVGVTGNYQLIANEHKNSANNFRIVALIFMSIMSIILIYTIWDVSVSENYDWTKSLIRLIAAAALSYPATYASRESSKHRKLESTNRRLELELASIEPFIELLPADKKEEVKERLAERYFGNDEPNDNPNQNEVSINVLERIIGSIDKLIKN